MKNEDIEFKLIPYGVRNFGPQNLNRDGCDVIAYYNGIEYKGDTDLLEDDNKERLEKAIEKVKQSIIEKIKSDVRG